MGSVLSQEEDYTPPPSPYEIRNRQQFQTSFTPSSPGGHKGLKNAIGENNCFLNVVVQALWHLDSFRVNFGTVDEAHFCTEVEACVFCALKGLFAQYEFSEERMIPPTALREALSKAFANESRFKIGEMYDAVETMVAVLQYLHCVQMGVKLEDEVPCEPPCCVHRVFGMNIVSRTECECGATSEPITSSMFLYLVYVSELRMLYDSHRELRRMDSLINAINAMELKSCPDRDKTQCPRRNKNQRFIQNTPKVVSLSLVYSSSHPDVEDIRKVLLTMRSGELDLAELFYGVSTGTMYDFRGMIVYYGRHYYAFFFSRRRQQWLCFDDERIKVVGNTWDCVIDNCVRSHCQPSVLFYEKRAAPNELPLLSPIVPNLRGQASGTLLRRSADRISTAGNNSKNTNTNNHHTSSSSSSSTIMSRTEPVSMGMGMGMGVSIPPYRSSAPIAVQDFGVPDEKEISTSLLSSSCNEKLSTSSSDSYPDNLSASSLSPKADSLIFEEIDDEPIQHPPQQPQQKGKGYDDDDEEEGGEKGEEKEQLHEKEKEREGGTVTMMMRQHMIEYVFDVESMEIGRGKTFCMQRRFDAFGIPWRLSLERTETGYIGAFVERLDAYLPKDPSLLHSLRDVLSLRVSVSFQCTMGGYTLSSSITQQEHNNHNHNNNHNNNNNRGSMSVVVGDGYFLCPQRQKRFLSREKYLGLSVRIKLL